MMRCIGYKKGFSQYLRLGMGFGQHNMPSKRLKNYICWKKKMLALLPDCIPDNTGFLIFEILMFKITAYVNIVYVLMLEFKAALRLIA